MLTAPRRKLVYPLYNQLAGSVETPEGVPVAEVPVFPEDSDEVVTVLFRLSLNQFVALASAIDVGSDIAYGADALQVWWIWVYSYMATTICQEMAQCFIDQNAALMTALAEALRTNQELIQAVGAASSSAGNTMRGSPLSTSSRAENLAGTAITDGSGNCLPNKAWGAALNLVIVGDRYITDIFQQIEAASNAIERAEIAAGNIPAFGQAISSVAGFADQLQEEVAEAYLAAYGIDYEVGLACEIFCLMTEDCTISVDDLILIMENRMGTITFEDFNAFVTFLATGTFAGDQYCDFMFYLLFMAMKFGQKFVDLIDLFDLSIIIGIGAENRESDVWEELCEDCEPPVVPNISLVDTFPGVIPTSPQFVENTATGSVWLCTYSGSGSAFGIPVTPQIDGFNVCCKLISASPVDQYQHEQCGGGLVGPAAGDGASPPDWQALGFLRSSGGTCLIEIEPA